MEQEHINIAPFKPSLVLDEIQHDHWIAGVNSKIEVGVLQPNGDWRPFCPKGEIQTGKYVETYNCTGFGYTNAIEILMRVLYGITRNYSDRGLAIVAGTRAPGNSPYTVAEAGRNSGLLDEVDLPFNPDMKTFEEWFSPNPLTPELARKALDFLKTLVPLHDWVPTDNGSLREWLKSSPLGITVDAWYRNAEGLYYSPPGIPDNDHFVVLVHINDDDTKVIFDSYPDEKGSYFKTLTKDHRIQYAMRYALKVADKEEQKLTIYKLLLSLYQQLLQLMQQKKTNGDVPPAPAMTMASLVNALIQVESNGNDNAVGDLGLFNKAYGCLQVRKPCVDDVNRVYGTNFTARQCLGNRGLSILIFERYMQIYATTNRLRRPVTDEDRARIWNGGPSGYLKTATIPYWNRVKSLL